MTDGVLSGGSAVGQAAESPPNTLSNSTHLRFPQELIHYPILLHIKIHIDIIGNLLMNKYRRFLHESTPSHPTPAT